MAINPGSRWGLFLLPFCFAVLLLYFLFFPTGKGDITFEAKSLQPQWYLVETARGEVLENKSIVGNCHICHAFWVPIPRSIQTSSPRFAHANIQLNHGSNDRCYNCHHIADRNKYVANDGTGIMVQTPEKLCERCHGLIYQDWLLGTHGKWTGKWSPENWTERITYTCTECHDPHNPLFRYDVIAPPPVWPDKFIRTEPEEAHEGPFSNFHIDTAPKEIF